MKGNKFEKYTNYKELNKDVLIGMLIGIEYANTHNKHIIEEMSTNGERDVL